MNLDLYVDTSRKGISMAISQKGESLYEEIVDAAARGETVSLYLDELLGRVGATLDDIKRVMVTVGPGSFSGLRTGVAFCQGICFSGNRQLFGVSTLQALEQFNKGDATAVVIRARNGYWYLRLDGQEFFDSTEDVISKLSKSKVTHIVCDEFANNDEQLKSIFANKNMALDSGKPLNMWAPLFDLVEPSLIQEANYIQPSYFEKLNK